MQGTAADIIKKAMIEFWHWLQAQPDIQAHLIMQVHDELVVEAKNDQVEWIANQLKQVMENAYVLNVPLLVDLEIGQAWN